MSKRVNGYTRDTNNLCNEERPLRELVDRWPWCLNIPKAQERRACCEMLPVASQSWLFTVGQQQNYLQWPCALLHSCQDNKLNGTGSHLLDFRTCSQVSFLWNNWHPSGRRDWTFLSIPRSAGLGQAESTEKAASPSSWPDSRMAWCFPIVKGVHLAL